MGTAEQLGRAAGRLAKHWRPAAKESGQFVSGAANAAASRVAKEWLPAARQSGSFIKHVLPAAAKPLHSLWHEILGFIFLVFAGIGVFKIWQHPGAMPPTQLAIVGVFIVVMAGYGISSVRKARRISRS